MRSGREDELAEDLDKDRPIVSVSGGLAGTHYLGAGFTRVRPPTFVGADTTDPDEVAGVGAGLALVHPVLLTTATTTQIASQPLILTLRQRSSHTGVSLPAPCHVRAVRRSMSAGQSEQRSTRQRETRARLCTRSRRRPKLPAVAMLPKMLEQIGGRRAGRPDRRHGDLA
jgi:hypothetical protein